MFKKDQLRKKRKTSIRKMINGTAKRPRLSVFRSNNHIYAQLIDDENKRTLASSSDFNVKSGTNVEKAKKVGSDIAKLSKELKIEEVVFDRNGYRFHGRVKELANAAREDGLSF